MKGLCVIILLITITCIVLTIQKKYIIESFISNSDYQKAKLAWDVCLKLPENMRLLNQKCLTAKNVLDNASKKSNRSQKLSIEFRTNDKKGKTYKKLMYAHKQESGFFLPYPSPQLLDIESKLGEFIYNGRDLNIDFPSVNANPGDLWNDGRQIDWEKGLYLGGGSTSRVVIKSPDPAVDNLYNKYWLSGLVANRSKSNSKKTISIIYDLSPDLFNGQGNGCLVGSDGSPYLLPNATAELITLGGFNLKRSQPVNVPGWDSLSNSLQNSYSQTYYYEDPIIGLHHSKVIFTIPESRNITFDEKFFTSLAAPVINAQTFEPKNPEELPTVYENRPVCIYPKRDWACPSYNSKCKGLSKEMPPIGGFTDKLGREPGFKNASEPNGPESNQDAQKTFNIGNHIVYFMVQNTGIIDYVDGGDNDSYKLKFWLLFDNFILAQDFEQLKEVPTFEVELSASEDIPNMEMEFPDDDTVILKVLKKEYVNGSLTDTYIEKIINMGTPIYSDIQESAIERVRFGFTERNFPNKNANMPDTISIKINKHYSGLWEDVNGANEIRHSFLPSIIRSGINQTSIVDEGNGNYSLFMNGELCYRKMEDDSGLTKAFNSEIEEIVFGVEGKYYPDRETRYSYIEFGMKAITVGIDLYDEMLDGNALFQKFLTFLPEDEKSKYCELVYQGQIDGLEEEKVELEGQINQIENDHVLEKQKLSSRINEVKVQRDEVQQTAIKAAELQLRELEGNRKKNINSISRTNTKFKKAKRTNKILLGTLITLILLLIVSCFFKFSVYGEEMGENLSESMSNMFGNNSTRYLYRGPRRIPFIGTDY